MATEHTQISDNVNVGLRTFESGQSKTYLSRKNKKQPVICIPKDVTRNECGVQGSLGSMVDHEIYVARYPIP